MSNAQYTDIPQSRFGLMGQFYTPDKTKKYMDIPLIVYLGGQGERLGSWGLLKMLKDGYEPNAYVYAPINQRVTPQGLHGIIKNVVKQLKIDPKKVYIFGYSLGGHQGLQMISDNPTFYKGMVCMGANPNRYLPAVNIYTKPITSFIIFRGENETGGLHITIEQFAKKMIKNGRKVEYISLPGVQHTGYGIAVNEALIEKLISL